MHSLVDRRNRLPHPLLPAGEFTFVTGERQPERVLSLPTYYIIADTHMDFGWFAPNILVQRKNFVVLEEVRKKIEEDAGHRFSLEASWMLEAYARQASPAQLASMLRLIQAGQISLAPHFVLLDDRLAGERAQIYNVLVGRRLAARYGVTSSNIFCAKDIFGLDAQTPQRERKLGNDMVFRARGDVPQVEDAIVHTWLAPDGKSWIYDVRQAGGYGSGMRLGHKPLESATTAYNRPMDNSPEVRNETAVQTIAAHDARYGPQYIKCGLAAGALYNGCDYERLQQDIGQVLAHLRQFFTGVNFRMATFADYGRLVRAIAPGQLDVYQGSLFGDGAAGIRDVDVTRIPAIKIPYVEAVRCLNDAEALAALAAGRGGFEDARGYLTEAWKDLLAVGTHDYISGSVTDYVMPEITFLLWQAREKAGRIIREAMGRMAAGLEVRYNDLEIVAERYSLLNLSAYSRTGLVELPVPASLRAAAHLQLRTETGQVRPVQLESGPAGPRALAVVDVPGFYGLQVTLEEAPSPPPAAEPATCLENDKLTVEPAPGGLKISTKDGREHRLWFDLVRDRGDTYTVDALNQAPWDSRLAAGASQVRLKRGGLVQELSLDIGIAAPKRLEEDRQTLSQECGVMLVTLTASLTAGLDSLRLDITVNNPAIDDYMLRLLVSSPQGPVLARDNFMVRPVSPVRIDGQDWQARNSYYDFEAGGLVAGQMALAANGLFAFRLEEQDGRLTLIKPILRGIGYVSCDDLVKRKDAAAAHRPAPQAQCHGQFTCTVYLAFDRAGLDENGLVAWADSLLKGLVVGLEGVTLAHAPRVIEGNAIVTGLKQPEDGSADLIYHVGNYGPGEAYLVFNREVEPCLLNEEPLGLEPSRRVALGPYEFGAVRVKR